MKNPEIEDELKELVKWLKAAATNVCLAMAALVACTFPLWGEAAFTMMDRVVVGPPWQVPAERPPGSGAYGKFDDEITHAIRELGCDDPVYVANHIGLGPGMVRRALDRMRARGWTPELPPPAGDLAEARK